MIFPWDIRYSWMPADAGCCFHAEWNSALPGRGMQESLR